MGLDRDIRVSLPADLPVVDVDLCALLGNALDNAREAAVKAEDKKISVRCRADKGMLMLKVTNVLTGDERDDLATTKTDKKHHGLGLSGMREIAQRYGGTLETTTDSGCFILLACLPLSGVCKKMVSIQSSVSLQTRAHNVVNKLSFLNKLGFVTLILLSSSIFLN